jgi:hypothetical protein
MNLPIQSTSGIPRVYLEICIDSLTNRAIPRYPRTDGFQICLYFISASNYLEVFVSVMHKISGSNYYKTYLIYYFLYSKLLTFQHIIRIFKVAF